MPPNVAHDHVVLTSALALAMKDASARQRLRALAMRPAPHHPASLRSPPYRASPPGVPERPDLANVRENAAAQRREAADQRAGAQAAGVELADMRKRLAARASLRGASTAPGRGPAAWPFL